MNQIKEKTMEQPKLTSDRAELIVNLLRDNPGVSMTLADIADETGLAVEDLAAHLEDLVSHHLVIREVTPDGFDVYRFPDEYQRGSTGPSGG
jgi:predicted ArsR family transcriptional regulator